MTGFVLFVVALVLQVLAFVATGVFGLTIAEVNAGVEGANDRATVVGIVALILAILVLAIGAAA